MANLSNNMLLAADPVTREFRRFLVGPAGCEVTGITFTPDSRTMFVDIQHPGEPREIFTTNLANVLSDWPDGDGRRPALGHAGDHERRRGRRRHVALDSCATYFLRREVRR
jgi:secreted PhoX family phosphatase